MKRKGWRGVCVPQRLRAALLPHRSSHRRCIEGGRRWRSLNWRGGLGSHTMSFLSFPLTGSVDNSEYMRNGDFLPTRLQAQQDAVNIVCHSKTRSNPENNVGLITLAKYVGRVGVSPVSPTVASRCYPSVDFVRLYLPIPFLDYLLCCLWI